MRHFTAATGCPTDLGGYSHNADSLHDSPVQMRSGKPDDTGLCCQSRCRSLPYHFSSNVNAVGCNSGGAVHQRRRRLSRSCSHARGRPEGRSGARTCLRVFPSGGHADRDRVPIAPEHLSWQLL